MDLQGAAIFPSHPCLSADKGIAWHDGKLAYQIGTCQVVKWYLYINELLILCDLAQERMSEENVDEAEEGLICSIA